MVYKRATDLKLKEDVPIVCNLLIANILDEGGPRGQLLRAQDSAPQCNAAGRRAHASLAPASRVRSRRTAGWV